LSCSASTRAEKKSGMELAWRREEGEERGAIEKEEEAELKREREAMRARKDLWEHCITNTHTQKDKHTNKHVTKIA
jgi:hypothetical protein